MNEMSGIELLSTGASAKGGNSSSDEEKLDILSQNAETTDPEQAAVATTTSPVARTLKIRPRKRKSRGPEPKTITILTEENPQIKEVEFILCYLLNVICHVFEIISSVTDGVWDGAFVAKTNVPHINVEIRLVKGSGSFLDYIVYDHAQPDVNTSVPVLLMESTKTTDAESRNTAIYQRITKFVVAKLYYPDTPLVLYYNTAHHTSTATSLFGRRMLATLDVKLYDVNGAMDMTDSPPFTSVEEVMNEKNKMTEKKGNISVKITQNEPHNYGITAKLSKGKHTTICNDPNKGLVTGIASVIFTLDKEATFTIMSHGVDVQKLKNVTNEKFWYANSLYELKLDGCELSSKGTVCPDTYWLMDTQSEKASTINYHKHMEQNGWHTIYHNHSSSARSNFVDEDGTEHQVPKDVTIPDVVVGNKERKVIQICEGKIFKDRLMGVKQLDELTDFIKYTNDHYKGYTIERGLCLYAERLSQVHSLSTLTYPIFFALDSAGSIYIRKTNDP
jgi:hypothetical protein